MASFAIVLASPASGDAIDLGHFVEAQGYDADSLTFVVERLSDGQTWISNSDRAQQRFSPASTSKIPHTLIALERGVATADTVFIWDGVPRSSRVWNQNHTLASAFQYSVVWVYQDIARATGQEVLSQELMRLGYGNANVGSVDQLTTYWLDDTLLISAAEQIEFISMLAAETLPLSEPTYSAARDIMVSDSGENWTLWSKTGWRYSENSMDIGWFVGWIECSNDTYVFAFNMDMPDTRYLSQRREITYAVLQEIGVFDCD
ncbi:MAG: penicillin-binding transpeptidase domain-containing protein [Pseudomonadota bacterium]